MTRIGKNPFKPGAGRVPPLRVGHAYASSHLRNGMDDIQDGGNGGIAILHGPRGNGKTTLLRELQAHAKESGVKNVELAETHDSDRKENVWVLTGPDAPQGESTEVSVQAGIPGLKSANEVAAPSASAHERSIRSLVEEAPHLLLIDEAHMLPAEIGRAVLNSIQRCVGEGKPLLAALAGTPGVIDNLRGIGASFVERATLLPVGRLGSGREVQDALATPARESGLPMDEDALDLLVKECQGYPFFLQLFGFSAWEAAHSRGGDRITAEDAKERIAATHERRWMFYLGRIDELSRLKVLREAVSVSKVLVAKGSEGTLSRKELAAALREAVSADGPSVEDVTRRLSHVGLIWANPLRGWEPGIPSLCAFICEQEG